MSLTGICIALTGAGTPFAFLTAALLVLCPNMVLAVLGAAVPATGGMYTYVRDYIGRKTGFFYLALLVAGQLVLAMFAITFAVYMHDLLPGTNQTVVAFVRRHIGITVDIYMSCAAILPNLGKGMISGTAKPNNRKTFHLNFSLLCFFRHKVLFCHKKGCFLASLPPS